MGPANGGDESAAITVTQVEGMSVAASETSLQSMDIVFFIYPCAVLCLGLTYFFNAGMHGYRCC